MGGGLAANRNALPSNNGVWPNLIRFDLTGTNHIAIGDPLSVGAYYQYGSSTSLVATVRFYLDSDSNPYNTNATLLYTGSVSGTGTTNVLSAALSVPTTNALPGVYRVLAAISDNTHTRYLYARQSVIISLNAAPPLLTNIHLETNGVGFTLLGQAGQRFAIQGSTNLVNWSWLQTNTLSGSTWNFVDTASPALPARYYRAVLVP
jgi:hypothetical protein